MNPASRVGAFAGGLLVALVAAFGVGTAFPETSPREALTEQAGGQSDSSEDAHAGHSAAVSSHVSGLSVTEAGYTLHPLTRTVPKPGRISYRFHILGPDGSVVRDYSMLHERELHLIVVRRDLTRFQHVHPTRGADGTWSIDLDIPDAGAYRVFTDTAPKGLQGRPNVTLGVDLLVGGTVDPESPPLSRRSSVDGYDVVMTGSPTAAKPAELSFAFRRNGKPVTDLQPYLGAFGHLVALRQGDLAYAHVHAGDDPQPGDKGGPQIDFGATFPTPGRYALFLDFSAGGKTSSAGFSVDVPNDGTGATGGHAGHGGGAEQPAGGAHAGHG